MKKIALISLSFWMSSVLLGQYNYGLETCERDVKIEGRLNIDDGGNNILIGNQVGNSIDTSTSMFDGRNNVFIGDFAGVENSSGHINVFVGNASGSQLKSGTRNTFIGGQSGFNLPSGSSNTFIGGNAGFLKTGGNQNTLIGTNSGQNNSNGSFNTFVGSFTGHDNAGSENVFIGYAAGQNEIGSNKLIIENSNSQSPLIYGEFDNDKIQINGSLHITEVFQLIPQNPPSGSCANNGEMTYGTDDELYLCKSGAWKVVMTN